MSELKTAPEELDDTGIDAPHYSNFDHRWDEGAIAALDEGKGIRHSGEHFHGLMWKDADGYNEEVRRFHIHVATVTADTPEELVREVNDRFGWE